MGFFHRQNGGLQRFNVRGGEQAEDSVKEEADKNMVFIMQCVLKRQAKPKPEHMDFAERTHLCLRASTTGIDTGLSQL